MDSQSLSARVQFTLYSQEVSGRAKGFLSGVRPNHYVKPLDSCVIGEVEFDGGSIEPGQSKEATIKYIPWEPFNQLLQPGFEYEVREGSNSVGKVKILKILSER